MARAARRQLEGRHLLSGKYLRSWIRLSYHMKNYGDLGGCYLPRPTASTDNTLLDLHNSS